MSFLFLCCCRPFLKGGDNGRRDFYDLLEISQDANVDDIKRAYKKKSLALHPDKLAQRGQVLTPEDQAKFQRVKEAYEILVEPKRRHLYDEFGENGMKIIDEPQSVDPQMAFTNFMRSSSYDRCAIFTTIVAITAFVLLWPVLLCLRTDKTISIPWTAIWTPLWVLDALFLFIFWFMVVLGPQAPPEGLEDNFKDDFSTRLINAVQFTCNVLFQIFLTLKLDKDVSWEWSKVFAPWLAWEGITLLRHLGTLCARVPADYNPDDEQAVMRAVRLRQAWMGLQNGLLRIAFCVLAILKLDNKIGVTWWVVFVPLWIYFGLGFLGIVLEYSIAQRLKGSLNAPADPEAAQPSEEDILREQVELMSSKAAMMCCNSSILLVIALLAVARIEGAQYSVFIIFIPLFIIVGCFTCALGCAVCCLRDPDQMMADHEGTPLNPQATTPSPIIPPSGSTSNTTNSSSTTTPLPPKQYTPPTSGVPPATSSPGSTASNKVSDVKAADDSRVFTSSPSPVMARSGGANPRADID